MFAVNSSPPCTKNAANLANIFKCIFLNEYDITPIQMSRKFVSRSPDENKPALDKGMAWRRIGNKPLSEPMLTRFFDAYMGH